MGISEFKSIFWPEFIHRIAGRMTVLLYALPLIFFLYKGRIKTKSVPIYSLILILFFSQGLMGWYMVKSGLVLNPHVSHFRLAAHLMLAIIVYSLLFWKILSEGNLSILRPSYSDFLSLRRALNLSVFFTLLQILLGALVAGLDAGLVYNSFPLMGDGIIPFEVTEYPIGIHSFYDPVFIQFIHRINAYILSIIVIYLSFFLWKTNIIHLRTVSLLLILTLGTQMFLGGYLVLYLVPLFAALAHQIVAVILLSILIYTYHIIFR
jgi:cytochrome c oxidase assembly protein subunit 15